MKNAVEKLKFASEIVWHSLVISGYLFWIIAMWKVVLGNWKIVPVMP